MEDTECPDYKSLQNLLTYQVHCVLPKLNQLTNIWPILGAALLRNRIVSEL